MGNLRARGVLARSTRRGGFGLALILSGVVAGAVIPASANTVPEAPPAAGVPASKSSAAPSARAGLNGLTPARLLDTRDGTGAPAGPLGPGASFDLRVTGVGGVPSDGVGAVVLNVTAVDPTEASFVTVWPAGSGRPATSNLNVVPGETAPNLVIVGVGTDGSVSLFNFAGRTHLVADVSAWLPEGVDFTALDQPARLLDTRGGPAVGAGGTIRLPVRAGGVLPPVGVGSVVVNVTATEATRNTFLTAYPSGEERPNASNVNASIGQSVPNLAVVKLGADGDLSIFNFAGETHVLVDVFGYFPDAQTSTSSLQGLSPARLLDTRDGVGAPAAGVAGGQAVELQVTGRGGVPADGVGAVVLNVTATEATEPSFVTVWDGATARPLASNLNVVAGTTRPNLVITAVGPAGRVALYNHAGSVHLTADVAGWFPVAAAPASTGDPTDGTAGTGIQGLADTSAPAPSGNAPAVIIPTTPAASFAEPPSSEDIAAGFAVLDRLEAPNGGVVATANPMPTNDGLARLYANEPRYPNYRQGFSTYNDLPAQVGRLFYTFANGAVSSCSATVVDRDLILTAAHCTDGAVAYRFWPDLYGTQARFGSWDSDVQHVAIHQAWQTLAGQTSKWAIDYAFVKLYPNASGQHVGDVVGVYGMLMDTNGYDLEKYNMGYPVEGWFDIAENGGRTCARQQLHCYPYYCYSPHSGRFDFGGGWYGVGWGCTMNGGISGGPVFAQWSGRWYVVGVNSTGGVYNYPCAGTCSYRSWTLSNQWSPAFRTGWLDVLLNYARGL